MTALFDTGAMRRMVIAYGSCLPASSGGCGLDIGPVENEIAYTAWLRTGLCPTCQGYPHGHHSPSNETP